MAKPVKLQSSLEYAIARAILSGLGALPRRIAIVIGLTIGRVGYLLPGNLRRTGQRNLEIAFPYSTDRERRRLLRGCFDNLGRLLAEFSQFPRLTRERLRAMVEYEGVERYWEANARGQGIILLTCHLGAWELLSFAHSALQQPLSFLVRPLDNPRVEEMIERIRTRFGNEPINKKSAARQALRLLRDGGTLGILADLNTQPREGVFVPFFGRLACTTTGAAILALRTNAVVFPVCGIWDKERERYILRCEPMVELVRTGDEARDIEINTARFTAAIEGMVRAYPDQWLWIHKRWKSRPPGEADLYNER